jgi:hypothetical protein
LFQTRKINFLIIAQAGALVFEAQSRIAWVCTMTKRKKKQVFRATKAVKEAAREKIGSPPPTRLVPDKKKELSGKHRPTLGKLLAEE